MKLFLLLAAILALFQLGNSQVLQAAKIGSAFDYTHLKQVEEQLKGADLTAYKLFLDGLVVAGTGPATLLMDQTLKIPRPVAPKM